MEHNRKENQQNTQKHNKKAFSIVELMVVVIILGLLASIVIPNLIGKSDDAKKQLVKVQMGQLKESLKLFRLDMGRYPTTKEGIAILVKKPQENQDEYANYSSSGYLGGDKIPKDPWGNPYIYISTGDTIELISLGADGKEGGKGINKDMKLSDL